MPTFFIEKHFPAKTIFVFLAFFLLAANYPVYAQGQKISVKKKSQILKDGQKQTILSKCYYSQTEGTVVNHYIEPEEFIKITNRKGELKVYFPEENKVSITQDFYFSSENELLYYFVNNYTEDLGLRKEGFKMTDSEHDGQYLVTVWKPEEDMKVIEKVEIVFENTIPIYSAYYNKNNKIIRKIYYSDYYKGTNFVLPKKITEITYTSPTDSTIKRTIFSDIKKNHEVDPYYLNFKIPEDAKSVD